MMNKRAFSILSLVSILAAGSSSVFAAPAENGVQINGVQINGVQINGVQINGVQINGVQINGVQINGVQINGVQINGTDLSASLMNAPLSTCSHSEGVTGARLPADCSPCSAIVSARDSYCANNYWDSICVYEANDWCSLTNDDFLGAEMTANLANGGTTKIRIDAINVVPDSTPDDGVNENADINMFTVSYYRAGYWYFSKFGYWVYVSPSWRPICPTYDDNGYYNKALAIEGEWRACEGPGCGGRGTGDGFVFACRDVGAVAKCAERLGYKPWNTAYICDQMPGSLRTCGTISQADHHEACVRMIRADYCGDGVAHTVNGTSIDVADGFGHNFRTMSTWGAEAVWNQDGAIILSRERYDSGSFSCPGRFELAEGGNFINVEMHLKPSNWWYDLTTYGRLANWSSTL